MQLRVTHCITPLPCSAPLQEAPPGANPSHSGHFFLFFGIFPQFSFFSHQIPAPPPRLPLPTALPDAGSATSTFSLLSTNFSLFRAFLLPFPPLFHFLSFFSQISIFFLISFGTHGPTRSSRHCFKLQFSSINTTNPSHSSSAPREFFCLCLKPSPFRRFQQFPTFPEVSFQLFSLFLGEKKIHSQPQFHFFSLSFRAFLLRMRPFLLL